MLRGEIITEANEATERGFPSRELSNQLNLRVVLSLTEMIFKNPAVFRKFRVMTPRWKAACSLATGVSNPLVS
jgi:hypothetical protein